MYKISKKMSWMEGGQLDRERKKDFYQTEKDFNVGAHDQVEVKIIQQCLKTILYKLVRLAIKKLGHSQIQMLNFSKPGGCLTTAIKIGHRLDANNLYQGIGEQ